MTAVRCRLLLPAANAIGCLLFVLLRDPVPGSDLAELERVHGAGGISINSGIMGYMACRALYSWSEWHGGEALGVKILETVNAPALIAAEVVDAAGSMGVAQKLSFCAWSWVLALYLLVTSSIQWVLLGTAIDRLRVRLRRGP